MNFKKQSYYYRHIPALCGALVALSSCRVWSQPAAFSPGQVLGRVMAEEITEASGMVASRSQKDVLWVHNDSDRIASVYAVAPQGTLLGSFRVKGATMRDWEDIALGPGPQPGQDYLYIGDIGDNQGRYPSITVYRVPEPRVTDPPASRIQSTEPVQALHLTYPDGPHDAETLLVDPLTRDIYIITKRQWPSRVYHAPYPQATDKPVTLTFVTRMPWGFATGGDIAPDGQSILIRSPSFGSRFQRIPNEPLWKAFLGSHQMIPVQTDLYAEAICFDAQGRGYYTLNEGRNQPIYYYLPTPPPAETAGEL